MSTVSDNLPTSSSTTTDETAHPLPTGSSTSIAPLISDPERQQRMEGRRRRRESSFLTRLGNVFLLPFNMWAPLPDYDLEDRLSNHPDERIHHDLYNILVGAQDVRTQQWRMAYWMVAISLVCTLGTAFIGIANAIVTFSDNPVAQKVLSIFVATFGVILSLLKGTGMPANAFMNVNRANDIIDTIEDLLDLPGNTFDIKKFYEIKTNWRTVRDESMSEQASIWKNLQK